MLCSRGDRAGRRSASKKMGGRKEQRTQSGGVGVLVAGSKGLGRMQGKRWREQRARGLFDHPIHCFPCCSSGREGRVNSGQPADN